MAVFSTGKLFLIKTNNPNLYVSHRESATGFVFSSDREILIVCDYCDLIAYRSDWSVAWHRVHLGMDGIEIEGVEGPYLLGRRCVDPPDRWKKFRVRVADGKNV